jgi:hypothetical protein
MLGFGEFRFDTSQLCCEELHLYRYESEILFIIRRLGPAGLGRGDSFETRVSEQFPDRDGGAGLLLGRSGRPFDFIGVPAGQGGFVEFLGYLVRPVPA